MKYFLKKFAENNYSLKIRQNWRLNLGTLCLVAGKLPLPLDMACHFETSYLDRMESASLISLLVPLLVSWSLTHSLWRWSSLFYLDNIYFTSFYFFIFVGWKLGMWSYNGEFISVACETPHFTFTFSREEEIYLGKMNFFI